VNDNIRLKVIANVLKDSRSLANSIFGFDQLADLPRQPDSLANWLPRMS